MKVRDYVRELLLLNQDALVVTASTSLYRAYEPVTYPAPCAAIVGPDGDLFEDDGHRLPQVGDERLNVVVIG